MNVVSFNPILNNETRALLLGTMPSADSLAKQQYYGHRQNQFWKLLFSVYEEPYSENYDHRVQFLLKQGLGLWDVLSRCHREGSLDSAIRKPMPNDILGLLQQYPNIQTLVFTSKNAEKYFLTFFKKEDALKGVRCLTLPSPSGANARMSLDTKLEYWKKIRQI